MGKVTFIEHDGTSQTVEAGSGQTLMQAATRNGVRGIVAECGGAGVCGTCHCHIDEAWLGATGTPGDDEKTMLEFSEHHQPNSRLGCQVRLSESLDGLVVHLPPSQP